MSDQYGHTWVRKISLFRDRPFTNSGFLVIVFYGPKMNLVALYLNHPLLYINTETMISCYDLKENTF